MNNHLHAQPASQLPVLQPSYRHDLLQNKQGIQLDCVQNVNFDQQGRLWFKTCGQTSLVKLISLVQYDGYRHDLPQSVCPDSLEDLELKYHDFLSENKLSGIYRNARDSTAGIFLMDLPSRKIHFYPSTESILRLQDVRMLPDSSILILSQTEENRYLQTVTGNELKTLSMFPNPTDSLPLLPVPGTGPLYRQGALWLGYYGLPLIKVDLLTKSIRRYTLADFPIENQPLLRQALEQPKPENIHFAVLESGSLFMNIGSHFFQFDEHKDQFVRIDQEFPGFVKAIGIYQDQKDNVCFVWEDEKGQLQALLKDTLGNRYDYSAFFQGVFSANLKFVISKDFFREVFVSETGSLHYMYVKKLDLIRNVLEGYFISSVMESADGTFLVNTVFSGWFHLSADLSEYKPFDGPTDCLPNPFTAEKSMVQQIIPDSLGNLWWIKREILYEYHPQLGTCRAPPSKGWMMGVTM